VLKAEYQAGFVQGHMQGSRIAAARDNACLYYTSTWAANNVLKQNFNYLITYLKTAADRPTGQGLNA